MTLTQLGAFVLVARLGSVRAAAEALGVSEPAVSQALAVLRKYLGDELLVRGPGGMTLTAGGARLLGIASQMVSLGAEAEAQVRAARGAPEQLRVVAESVLAEYVVPGLLEAFESRVRAVDASVGVARSDAMGALVHEHLADVALGHGPGPVGLPGMVSHPVMRARLVVVGAPGSPRRAPVDWLVDPAFDDPASPVAAVLARLRVPEAAVRVYPSQAAALVAAAEGEGLAPVLEHLVLDELTRGRLRRVAVPGTPCEACWYAGALSLERRAPVVTSFLRFLATPVAMQLMHRPRQGTPPGRFRPPVYVTIWSGPGWGPG
ncbi:MAG: LysR family transcriptional regulator [Actinomycetes bacterium]